MGFVRILVRQQEWSLAQPVGRPGGSARHGSWQQRKGPMRCSRVSGITSSEYGRARFIAREPMTLLVLPQAARAATRSNRLSRLEAYIDGITAQELVRKRRK